MLALFLFVLGAFAAKPTLSITSASQVDAAAVPVANTMMFDVVVHYTNVGTTSTHDHDVYLGVGTTGSAASTCATANGTPDSPGLYWTYGAYQVATAGAAGDLHFHVYNFQPGAAVYVKAAVGAAAINWGVNCNGGASIGTPTLPAGLADLNLNATASGSQQSKYVLFDTDDCSAADDGMGNDTHLGAKPYLVVADTAGKIRWYLDIGAKTTETGTNKLTGWHYQAATGHIVGVVEHGYVYNWNFNGSTNGYEIKPGDVDSISPSTMNGNYCNGSASTDEGPCVSHDAFESGGGNTYVITSYDRDLAVGPTPPTGWDGVCTSGETFVQDGYSVWNTATANADGSATFVSQANLVDDAGSDDDFDPTQTDAYWNDGAEPCDSNYWSGGPSPGTGDMYDPVIDYTHANAISVYRPASTDWVTLSLLHWNAIARFDGSSNTLKWILSGDSNYDGATGGVNVIYADGTHFTVAPGITGTASFGGQHGAHVDSGDNLVLFDNNGSRALKIALTGTMNPGTRTNAQITKSWIATDPANTSTTLTCVDQGGAEMVGTSVLLDCNDAHTIEEYADGYGDGTTGHAPDLALYLTGSNTQSTTGDDNACDNLSGSGDTYPNDPSFIHGWYRSYPLTTFGPY